MILKNDEVMIVNLVFIIVCKLIFKNNIFCKINIILIILIIILININIGYY